MIEVSPAAREVILAFADDEHLMGQQHTEWIGVAPFLEEDLAFASIGQDELGHAALLFELLVGNDDAAIDALAFYREGADWRSCALVEVKLPEWGDTLVRHWMYDAAEQLRWGLFADSSEPALRDVSVRALSEERFHRQHADALLDALLAGDAARERILSSVTSLLPLGLSMFDGVASEGQAIDEGIISAGLADLRSDWKARVESRFGGVDWADVGPTVATGRTARHEDFAPLISRMLEVLDLDRSVTW